MLSDEKRTALIQMCHEAGVMLQRDSKFGHPDYTSVQSSWPALEILAIAVAEAAVKAEREGQELDRYDAGLLGDFGGGNAEWWQDYIRAELDRAHDFYQSQMNTPPAAPVPEQASAAVPEECPHLIWFDDQDMKPIMFAGSGARTCALKKFEQVSMQWNAHLFVLFESNSRDSKYPSVRAMLAASQPEVK